MTQQNVRPTALITGASGGIGEALAEQLAAKQIGVVLVARTESKLQALADRLSAAHGVRADMVALDLSDPHSPEKLFQATEALELNIDCLVNNAGFASYGEFHELPLDHEMQMIQVNIAALTELTHRYLPGMVERGRGRVLNVASTAAFLPGPLMSVYYASKAYVLSFSEGLNEELRGTGVSVTALCPGPVETGFQARAQMEASKMFTRPGPNPMLLSADEVARQGLEAMFRGQAVQVPGLANKLTSLLPRFLPRRAVPPIIKGVQERGH